LKNISEHLSVLA